MNKRTFRHTTLDNKRQTYTRISKQRAKKTCRDQRIHACPCNLRPGGPFGCDVRVYADLSTDVDQLFNEIEFYNCINSETGNYLSFYVVTEE